MLSMLHDQYLPHTIKKPSFITKINLGLKRFQRRGKYRRECLELEMEESFRAYMPHKKRTNGISISFKQTNYLNCVEKNSGSNMENVLEKTESKRDHTGSQ